MAATDISPIILACHICGCSFERRQGQNKYCGEPCRRENERLYRLRKRAEHGLRIAGQTIIHCERCGFDTVFSGARGRYCADCKIVRRSETYRAHRERHPEKIRATQKASDKKRKFNPEYLAKRKIYTRKQSAIRLKNPRGRLDHRMSQLVRGGLGKGIKGGRTWESLVGYSLADLAKHLERQFVKNMSWSNMDKWHIDHILPKASFEYQSPADDAFKACWALSNLRPLWSGENISKGAKRTLLI